MAKKAITLTDSSGKTHTTPRPQPGDKIDTDFGVATVLKYYNGKVRVLLPNDVTATFQEIDFFGDFVC